MTQHVPMLSSYAANILTQGGRFVHTCVNGHINMHLEDNVGNVVMGRAFAECRYLLDNGLARVDSISNVNGVYRRVIVQM